MQKLLGLTLMGIGIVAATISPIVATVSPEDGSSTTVPGDQIGSFGISVSAKTRIGSVYVYDNGGQPHEILAMEMSTTSLLGRRSC